jgi:signal transduction histidine kinase
MTETESRLAREIRTLAGASPGHLAELSHELRTPLTIIAGYIEILQDDNAEPLTRAQQTMLATVDRNIVRLWRLIEDVLDLSNIESHPFKSTRSPVSLTKLTARAVAAVQPQAAAKGVTVTARLRRSLTIRGDPAQLGRLLSSLLSSAVMSAPGGGRIQVSADRNGAAAVLRVSGESPAVPAAGEQKSPFTGSSRATQVGLALCRTIAANHGGELELVSSSITVRLPLTDSKLPVGEESETGRG